MKYKHIFFDLDHTIWDFDKNAQETLQELYVAHSLKKLGLHSADLFIETYTRNNHQLWADYHIGNITKEVLRKMRFKKTFMDLGLNPELIPETFEQDYVVMCPTKTNLFPHAHETLQYLHGKYKLHLISNGFQEAIEMKMAKTNLAAYFQNIIISEIVGVNKPDKAIYAYAFKQAQALSNQECVMIGDSIVADVRGALNFGIDAIYFNPLKLETPEDISVQISHLQELMHIL